MRASTFHTRRISLLALLASVGALGCLLTCRNQERSLDDGLGVVAPAVPRGFPALPIPADNQPTVNRIALGKRLFSDPLLSRDSTISCATCHDPAKLFADGLPLSKGIEGRAALRNAPSLVNCAYLPNTMWDGGVPTLEQQVLSPISNPVEMDFDVNLVVARLNAHREYPGLFQRAYAQSPSVYTLTRAIACFERTLLGPESRYDKFLYDRDTTALTASERRGMTLFFGERGECFHCHGEYNFTDYSFKNNGLYRSYADSGRARITLRHDDVGKFRVPSLRNVARTAPYMHDGSLPTLEAVVDHYNRDGMAHVNKSGLLKPMHLSGQEKQDLVAFLGALGD
jgi:cytochrome c peroxidase